MLRRPAWLALTALALVAATPPRPGAAGGIETAAVCRGVTLERFEQRLPADTRRYVVGARLAPPFADLWRKSPQAKLAAAAPDAVTVYATARRPLLVAYRAGGCVLAVLAVPRDALWRVLRKELGQPA